MADEYVVVRRTLGSRVRVELTAREYQELVKALDGLARVVDVEEAYDILISNYMEYEKAIAGILIEEEVRQRMAYDAFNRDRRHMSRVTANLLSSARLFRDLTDVSLPKLLGRKALATFREAKAQIAEASFPYRFMEELRNHSQHENFAVTGLSYGANWLEHKDEIKATRVHTFKPSVAPRLLAEFPRFKDLLAEYRSMRAADPSQPESIDLTLYVRHYVMGMGDVLLAIRKMLEDAGVVEHWNSVVGRWLSAFLEADGSTTKMGVEAEHLRDGVKLDYRHLGSDLDDVIARLQKENRKLVNLHRIQFRI